MSKIINKKALFIVALIVFGIITLNQTRLRLEYYLLRISYSQSSEEREVWIKKASELPTKLLPLLIHKYSDEISTRFGTSIYRIIGRYPDQDQIDAFKEISKTTSDERIKVISNIALFGFQDQDSIEFISSHIEMICSHPYIASNLILNLKGMGYIDSLDDDDYFLSIRDKNMCQKILEAVDFSMRQ